MNRIILDPKINRTNATHYHSTHASFAEAEAEAELLNWADPFHRYYVDRCKVFFTRR